MNTFHPLIGRLPIILRPLIELEGRVCDHRAIPGRLATCRTFIGGSHSTIRTFKLIMTRIDSVARVTQGVTLPLL